MRIVFRNVNSFGYYNKINLATSGSTFKVHSFLFSLDRWIDNIGNNCYLFLTIIILNLYLLENIIPIIWFMLIGILNRDGLNRDWNLLEILILVLSAQDFIMAFNFFREPRPTRTRRGKSESLDLNATLSEWKNHQWG